MALKAVVDSLDGLAPEIAALYRKGDTGDFILDAEGVEDVKGLKSALVKERTAVSDAVKKLKEFEGIDPVQIREMMRRLESDEVAKLLAEGKTDKVLEMKIGKVRQDLEAQVAAAVKRADEEAAKASKYRTAVLENRIREAASKAGLLPQAIDDALYRGKTMFDLDDNGNAVQIKDGQTVLGKDGKSPFGPGEWLDGMKDAAPHWFPATGSGTGSQGSKGGPQQGNSKVISRDDPKAIGANLEAVMKGDVKVA